MKAERDKYRNHRDDLAGMVSNKVIDAMEQHMMNDSNLSETSFHSHDDFDKPAAQTNNED